MCSCGELRRSERQVGREFILLDGAVKLGSPLGLPRSTIAPLATTLAQAVQTGPVPRADRDASPAPCRLAARPPEQPAPTACTPTIGFSRHNSPRRPDLVCQHISTLLSIAAQHSTHHPTPPAATPATRASPPTRCANLSPADPPRATQPPLQSDSLPRMPYELQ